MSNGGAVLNRARSRWARVIFVRRALRESSAWHQARATMGSALPLRSYHREPRASRRRRVRQIARSRLLLLLHAMSGVDLVVDFLTLALLDRGHEVGEIPVALLRPDPREVQAPAGGGDGPHDALAGLGDPHARTLAGAVLEVDDVSFSRHGLAIRKGRPTSGSSRADADSRRARSRCGRRRGAGATGRS